MIKITKKESNSLKLHLPPDHVKTIRKKLNNRIGERMIYLILEGKWPDRHGVLSIATSLAKENKLQKDETRAILKSLALN